jgi:hypothetical protein
MRRAVARGRVFPQSFSTDRRYGRLSLKAVALFPLMWVNADDQGRLCGEPEEIKYICCPNVKHIAEEDVPTLLQELQDNKLILLYNTPKSPAIQLLDWWDPHRAPQWAWPSDYSPPEGWQDHLRYKKDSYTVETLNWPLSAESAASLSKSIYFILDEAANAVKIGISDSPDRRLKEFQSTNPHPLKLLKVIGNSTFDDEQGLHQRFAKSAMNSEWFNYSEEIKTFISGENSAEPSPDASPDPPPEPSPENPGKTTRKKPPFPRTPFSPKDSKDIRKRRGRGNSPEPSGDKPSPSAAPSSLSVGEKRVFELLKENYRMRWGTVRAKKPTVVIPREIGAKVGAQLRDLAIELCAAGGGGLSCDDRVIKEAFDEAAKQQKFYVSYVRRILFDWLDIEK